MLWGNIIFAIASFACGLAGSGLVLMVARIVQGVGSALVITSGIALIATTYPAGHSRTRAFSWLGVSSGVAMAFGPTIGGLVASAFGWRWIFLANVPVCLLIAWWVPRLVAETREASPRSLDWVGMALLTAALFTFIEALLHGKTSLLPQSLGLLLSALLLAAFVIQQGRRTLPVLDPTVFLSWPMIGIAMLLSAVSIGYWAVLVFLPLFLGAAYGWTMDQAGFCFAGCNASHAHAATARWKIGRALWLACLLYGCTRLHRHRQCRSGRRVVFSARDHSPHGKLWSPWRQSASGQLLPIPSCPAPWWPWRPLNRLVWRRP